jgi:hypothetical protein
MDGVNGVTPVKEVNKLFSVTRVIITLSDKCRSQLSAERPVQQRLLPPPQRRKLAGVEAGEALGS